MPVGFDSDELLLDVDEILEPVAALGDPDRFAVADAVYTADADGVTVETVARTLDRPVDDVVALVETLVEAGVLAEWLPCRATAETEYAITEFGRIALEDGVYELFAAAEVVGAADELRGPPHD